MPSGVIGIVGVPGPHRDDVERAVLDAHFDARVSDRGNGGQVAPPDLAIVDARDVAVDDLPILLSDPLVESAPILLLTTPRQAAHRILGLNHGVDDDAVDPVDNSELITRVQRCLARSRIKAFGTNSLGDVVIDRAGQRLVNKDVSVGLTSRELGVLQALLRRQGRVVSKQALLNEAWGRDERPTTINAVEAHVSALRRKLQIVGAPLVRTVHGRGYVIDVPA